MYAARQKTATDGYAYTMVGLLHVPVVLSYSAPTGWSSDPAATALRQLYTGDLYEVTNFILSTTCCYKLQVTSLQIQIRCNAKCGTYCTTMTTRCKLQSILCKKMFCCVYYQTSCRHLIIFGTERPYSIHYLKSFKIGLELAARHFTVYAALWTEKGKSLNKQCFYVSIKIVKCFAVSKVTTRVRMLPFGTDTAPQSFCHSFIALSMIRCWLFEVGPEIRCSVVSSWYCCYGNHATGSKHGSKPI